MATTEADRQMLAGGGGAGSTLGETLGGVALVVLGILALAKVDPRLLNSIAVIVAGIAFLIEDGALARRYASALSRVTASDLDTSAVADGMSAGALAGVGGIVLGILAIIGIASSTLTAVAIIGFGASVLFDFAARSQIKALRMVSGESSEHSSRVALAAVSSTNTAAMLIAVGLIALGILSLAGLVSAILVSVALLSLGAYLFLDSTAITKALFGGMA